MTNDTKPECFVIVVLITLNMMTRMCVSLSEVRDGALSILSRDTVCFCLRREEVSRRVITFRETSVVVFRLRKECSPRQTKDAFCCRSRRRRRKRPPQPGESAPRYFHVWPGTRTHFLIVVSLPP